jgi:hypothetical protein
VVEDSGSKGVCRDFLDVSGGSPCVRDSFDGGGDDRIFAYHAAVGGGNEGCGAMIVLWTVRDGSKSCIRDIEAHRRSGGCPAIAPPTRKAQTRSYTLFSSLISVISSDGCSMSGRVGSAEQALHRPIRTPWPLPDNGRQSNSRSRRKCKSRCADFNLLYRLARGNMSRLTIP